jgi:hypothetical protein
MHVDHCCGRSLVSSPEVFLEGVLQVKPAKDGVFLKVDEPSTGWTNKVQLEYAAGHIGGPFGKADCVEVVINPGIGSFTAIIMLQVCGYLEVQAFWLWLL